MTRHDEPSGDHAVVQSRPLEWDGHHVVLVALGLGV